MPIKPVVIKFLINKIIMENKFFLNSGFGESGCDSSNTKCCFKKLLSKICPKFNKTVIAVVNLSGVIGKESKFSHGINSSNCYPLLKRAFNTKNVKAVALDINSPGGSPVQSELIYNQIRQLSESTKIPVYTFAQDLAASGGYWLLCAGDEMYAHNASIIGSIGVIFSSFGFVELIKKAGISKYRTLVVGNLEFTTKNQQIIVATRLLHQPCLWHHFQRDRISRQNLRKPG